MLDKPWSPGVVPPNQPRYQPVQYCTCWLVLDDFNNCNIITFSDKNTQLEEFEDIHKVVLDVISYNMVFLVKTLKYGARNTTYPKIMDYFVVNYVQYANTLQE